MTYTDPFREMADEYTRLSDEYTAEVLRLREQLARAGHRTPDDHDCFAMNCHTLGDDVRRLTEALAREPRCTFPGCTPYYEHDPGFCRNRVEDDNGAPICDCHCDDCNRGWHPDDVPTTPGLVSGLWMLRPCATCGHLGFSHDNADECAECQCERWVAP